MEVNKGEAERCRDMGAESMRRGDYGRAVKLLSKSLKLYPLPGVDALLSQAAAQMKNGTRPAASASSSNQKENESRRTNTASAESSTNSTSQSASRPQQQQQQQQAGSNGRSYTEENVQVVQRILKAKEGGRGAHYRVLGLQRDATEAQIKKAYRKISLKVHPDKNAAPHADEAFKSVGLAYATLSDSQKKLIYDRYGEEDPDNRGGGGGGGGFARRGGGVHMRPGQEVSPEEIFNMFFGGGMPGAHVYRAGFGPGVHFARGGGGFGARPRAARRGGQADAEPEAPGLGILLQFLPIILIAALSFMKFNDADMPRGAMPGEDKYFSLTNKKPFTNQLSTRLTTVKDIPYYVSDRFLHTYNRNRYQLGQVEAMVERAYESYLVDECKNQFNYKLKLEATAKQIPNKDEREQKLQHANNFELSRCTELEDLFPKRKQNKRANAGYYRSYN